jgi:hypothetical protein
MQMYLDPAPRRPDKQERLMRVFALVLIAVFIYLMATGCTSPKSMMARKDCDDKMRLVVEAMRARTDTFVIYRTDTIIARSVRSDTILKIDTLVHTIEKERLRVQWQIRRDTMHIQAQCRTDTIYRTVAETTIKQGSLTTLVPEEKESSFMPGWLWLVFIAAFCSGAFLIYRHCFA